MRQLGGAVIAFAYGEVFSPAAGLLTVLASSLVFALANGVLFQGALAMGLERWCALGATVAALFNVSANLILLPRYGVAAAAWVTVVTEMVVGLLLVYGLSSRSAWAKQNTLENEL